MVAIAVPGKPWERKPRNVGLSNPAIGVVAIAVVRIVRCEATKRIYYYVTIASSALEQSQEYRAFVFKIVD